ncbi:hypothetical protein C6501_03405 [Candidatus Poribacteria bacterium]|nr:MAG: hypothetical protein C6501_03405 [Candidatus Poribacteria bacterium]
MSKLITTLLLAGFIVSNSDDSKYADKSYEELLRLKYKAPQRIENPTEPGGIEIEAIRWYHQNKSVGGRTYDYNPKKVKETIDLPQKLSDRSNSYIECDQGIAPIIQPFDFPLRGKSLKDKGWLYYTWDTGTVPWFFDTKEKEHWVLPNVYCNSKNILAAVSWMRSHEDEGMHARFKGKDPPFYDGVDFEDRGKDKWGVYCDWDGWLYDSDEHFHFWFDAYKKSEELFTFINVYCHTDKTVRFFAKAEAHQRQQEGHMIFPFRPRHAFVTAKVKEAAEYPDVYCNWTGWLFADTTDKPWEDKDKHSRHSHEKYYAIDKHSRESSKKAWMNGRVMNPFCSKLTDRDIGIVTALRVYCFYTKENRCSDLETSQ